VWNKWIGNNSGRRKQARTQESMSGQERIILRQMLCQKAL